MLQAGIRVWLSLMLLMGACVGLSSAEVIDSHASDAPSSLPEQAAEHLQWLIEPAAEYGHESLNQTLNDGYAALRAEDYAAAREAFRSAVARAPERADLWRQLGYIEINLDNKDAAIAAFETSLDLEPDQAEVALQVAYLEQARGRNRTAAGRFHGIMVTGPEELRRRACDAYSVTRGLSDRLLPEPLFLEVYAAPEYFQHFDVAAFPVDARAGASFGETTIVDVYASARVTTDTRSGGSAFGPQIYFDNAAIFGGGVRVVPHSALPISLFAEAGGAYDLIDRRRNRWREDYRGGLVAYKTWNVDLDCASADMFAPRPVADLYSDAIYYSRYDNLISFNRFRPGFRFFDSEDVALDIYAIGAVSWDTLGLDDNNFVDVGAGAGIHIYGYLPLTLRAEMVHRLRSGDPDYTDLRLRLEYGARF